MLSKMQNTADPDMDCSFVTCYMLNMIVKRDRLPVLFIQSSAHGVMNINAKLVIQDMTADKHMAN